LAICTFGIEIKIQEKQVNDNHWQRTPST